MNELLFSALIGIAAGCLDILPMVLKKMDRRAIVSAFLQYFFASVVILNINLPLVPWFLQGGLIALCLALLIVIIVSVTDKKAVPAIAGMSVIRGTLISAAGHFLK